MEAISPAFVAGVGGQLSRPLTLPGAAAARASPAAQSFAQVGLGPAGALGVGAAAGAFAGLARRGRAAGRAGARRSAGDGVAEAVAQSRMITVEEETIRKALGGLFLVLYVWQAAEVYSTGSTTLSLGDLSPYALLAVLASNAVGFFGSGYLNIWGCVAALKWNMDSPFSFSEAPDEYLDFLQQKRREMMGLVVAALAAGAVEGGSVAWLRGEPDKVGDAVQAMGVLFVITAAGLGAYGFTQGGDRRSI